MSTLAARVCETLTKNEITAFSIYAGQAITTEGRTVRFPVGLELKNRKNEQGGVAYSLYMYADGSRLEYRDNQDGSFKVNIV